MRAYKWLLHGRGDPVAGRAWPEPGGVRSSGVKMRRYGRTLTHATGLGGLPYELAEELWEIELEDPVSHGPFPDQREHVPDPRLALAMIQRLAER